MLDRETTLQITVSLGAVLAFVAVAAVVSMSFGTNAGTNSHLSETGGLALVGGIALFVVITTVAGLWLARQEFPDDTDGDAADGA